MAQSYQYLFGPVPSRRLGRSLGVDLTPFKTCPLDCVFCQLGRTTHKTCERRAYVPTDAVVAELDAWLRSETTADRITLAGSGEPTLHSGFGEVLRFVREQSDIPTALLSNGTLFTVPEVRDAAAQATIVKLSLGAWDQASFERLNRPCSNLVFSEMLDGFQRFREHYSGKLWIEVFLVPGINGALHEVEQIAAHVNTLAPDAIHLNTAVRPPAEAVAIAMERPAMEALAGLFRPAAIVVAEFSATHAADVAANEETILAMLQRRPCTARQIGDVFGMHLNEVSKYVGKLARTGQIKPLPSASDVYYTADIKLEEEK